MQVQTLATIGRIILGLYFLAAGAGKIFNPAPPEQIAHMVATFVPWPELKFTLAAACEATAGLCFIIVLHVRLVAMLLGAFTASAPNGKIIARNSAVDRAVGPSRNNRSRGRSLLGRS